MSAVFEILIYQKNIMKVDDINTIINKYSISVSLDTIETMDNWLYENQQEIDIHSINDYVIKDKIVQLSGLLNDKYRCGIQIQKVDKEVILHNIWISTKDFPHLDTNYITSENKAIYELITNIIIDNIPKNYLIFSGIGVETSLNYNTDYETMIKSSNNIVRWITTQKDWKPYLNNYDLEQDKDMYIFSLNQ